MKTSGLGFFAKSLLIVATTAIGATLFLTATAQATLGGAASSVEKDRSQFSSAQRSITKSTHSAYHVQEMKIDGTFVREYVSSSGIVFAIAWNGLSHPDLSKLLGNYNADYQVSRKKHKRVHGRHDMSLKSDHLVVEKWGHMRDLQGRAYDPSLLPTGVSLDDIK